jgi:hypothetical protein
VPKIGTQTGSCSITKISVKQAVLDDIARRDGRGGTNTPPLELPASEAQNLPPQSPAGAARVGLRTRTTVPGRTNHRRKELAR